MHGHAMKIGSSTQRRLACLGDASRYRLVMALASGARCVSDLAEAVGLSQSCTTRHLQALQAAGLVRRVRDGKRVMVRLERDEPEVGAMLDWVLERVRAAARAPQSRGPGPASHASNSNGSRRGGHPGRAARPGAPRPAAGSRSGVGNGGSPAPRTPEPVEISAATEAVEAAGKPGTDGALDRDHERDVGEGEGRPIRRPDTIEDYLL